MTLRLGVLFSFLAISTMAFAQSSLTVLKISSDNRKILFARGANLSVGTTLYVIAPGQARVEALATLKGCNANGCVAEIVKRRRGSVITTGNIVSTTAPGQVAQAKKAPEQQSLLAPQVDKVATKDQAQFVSFSLGGPMSYGLRAGYVREWEDGWRWGFNLGKIDHEFNEVGLSAIEVSGRVDYFLSRWSSWGVDFYGVAEAGILKSTIDFTQIDTQGFEIDSTAPFVSFLLALEKNWQTWGIFAKVGYSMNFYDAEYEEGGVRFNTPFDGGLISMEGGLSYRF